MKTVADQQSFNGGADGVAADGEEHRGDHVSRTLLDHSVLFDTVSKSAEKQILKAVEEQKEKLNDPFVPLYPVEAGKTARQMSVEMGRRGKQGPSSVLRYVPTPGL